MTPEEMAKIPCACVSQYSEDCARIRDSKMDPVTGEDYLPWYALKRHCECSCHDEHDEALADEQDERL